MLYFYTILTTYNMETQQKKPSAAVNIIVFVIMLAVIFFVWRGCSSSEYLKPMKVNVHLGYNSLTLISGSANSYSNVTVKINGDYKLTIDKLSAFESSELSFDSFANDEGKRFNSLTDKVTDVYISGTWNGQKYWDSFKPNP